MNYIKVSCAKQFFALLKVGIGKTKVKKKISKNSKFDTEDEFYHPSKYSRRLTLEERHIKFKASVKSSSPTVFNNLCKFMLAE